MTYKTGVIKNPLGQTHSLTSSNHCFLFCFARFEKWGRTNGRTTCAKIVITTGRECGLAEWSNIYFTTSVECAFMQLYIYIRCPVWGFLYEIGLISGYSLDCEILIPGKDVEKIFKVNDIIWLGNLTKSKVMIFERKTIISKKWLICFILYNRCWANEMSENLHSEALCHEDWKCSAAY